jgi:hypothetical protein
MPTARQKITGSQPSLRQGLIGSLVARIYAGILGPLAYCTSVARGVLHAWPTEKTLLVAWTSLLAFAAAGLLIGWVATRIVDEEVRGRIAAEPGGAKPGTQP